MCNYKQPKLSKYQINGYIIKDSVEYPSVWYVDTFEVNGTNISYKNSDGTVISIQPPYKIQKHH